MKPKMLTSIYIVFLWDVLPLFVGDYFWNEVERKYRRVVDESKLDWIGQPTASVEMHMCKQRIYRLLINLYKGMYVYISWCNFHWLFSWKESRLSEKKIFLNFTFWWVVGIWKVTDRRPNKLVQWNLWQAFHFCDLVPISFLKIKNKKKSFIILFYFLKAILSV